MISLLVNDRWHDMIVLCVICIQTIETAIVSCSWKMVFYSLKVRHNPWRNYLKEIVYFAQIFSFLFWIFSNGCFLETTFIGCFIYKGFSFTFRYRNQKNNEELRNVLTSNLGFDTLQGTGYQGAPTGANLVDKAGI